jgi:5-methyltetrahydrofolate--homocysteine methyltransferase
MTEHPFLKHLHTRDYLIADGATGTNLIARGLPTGKTAEHWVLEQPEQILRLHKDFLSAGANLILTSTFGATSLRLAGTDLAGRSAEINQRAATLARQAAEGSAAWVAGSLGPVGALLKPYGPLEPEAVAATYAEQAAALAESGVDLLVIETQFDLGEAKAAIQGVRSVTDLPLVCSFSYDRGRKTMMGVSPVQADRQLEDSGIDLIGINCGRSLEENLLNLQDLYQVTRLPIWFKPNAGLPQLDAVGNTSYTISPEAMGNLAPTWSEYGAKVIGGCCGTSPEHLAAISRALRRD